jgi:hypothetical protein
MNMYVYVEKIWIYNIVVYQKIILNISKFSIDGDKLCLKFCFFFSPDKIAEWNLDPSLIDEIVDASKCQSCLTEPLDYVW